MMTMTMVSWTLGIKQLDPMMDKVRQFGLDSIWFAGDHKEYSAAAVKASAAKKGVKVIAIDPFNCKPPIPEKASAEAAVAYFTDVVQFAADIGNVPMALQGLSQWTVNCKTRDEANERLLKMCRAVDAFAKAKGVRLMYEAANQYEVPLIHSSEECVALLDAIGSDNIGMTLDSFHMHTNEQSSVRAIVDNAKRLKAYHISDSGRGGIGSGSTDFIAEFNALKKIGFNGIAAVEVVLPELIPSGPPQTARDRARLDIEINRSLEVWKALGITSAPAPLS